MTYLHAADRRDALPRLSPTQQVTFDRMREAITGVPVIAIEGRGGLGHTTIMRALQAAKGGRFLTMDTIAAVLAAPHRPTYEQAVYEVLRDALAQDDIVFVDGLANSFQAASFAPFHPRAGLFAIVFKALYDLADAHDKRIVLSLDRQDLRPHHRLVVTHRPLAIHLPDLGAKDYAHFLIERFGPDALAAVDFERVYRFSRKLSAHHIQAVCNLLAVRGHAGFTTEDVIAVIAGELLRSNVELAEVEPVDLNQLANMDMIVETLDRTILLPLREPELAAELGLEAKRGVLIHGAPGTGKTTIGRALAHMMKGKFFMIDGDINHDAGSDFVREVDKVFSQAACNSPSVIFVDDADVILGDPRMQAFGRYLLTKLDGIQSESAGRVCVMMTAMNIAAMPRALLRSGRLEVWLETALPDAATRAAMVRGHIARGPDIFSTFDLDAVGAATEGFTPADLRRLVGDVAGYVAYDRHTDGAERPLDAYFAMAVEDLRRQKALAEAAAGQRGGLLFH
ncbi:AAA+-type ATPase, SpoVK/Ycf46/Vps4 family [Novosphingobium sp. CF614]|uniref:AAA family ATPase n=1 Tax=Novosphingobium sp. CF614 TaxID=1884364 RepID=UPI0008EAC210|nr:ATP-binding protein [Novosphingobium sp. CF614]SFF92282.1 AAA+-type ATPase, SpoVK/Ycf46/Vps4 family [Novosphingobium sp. CF614]